MAVYNGRTEFALIRDQFNTVGHYPNDMFSFSVVIMHIWIGLGRTSRTWTDNGIIFESEMTINNMRSNTHMHEIIRMIGYYIDLHIILLPGQRRVGPGMFNNILLHVVWPIKNNVSSQSSKRRSYVEFGVMAQNNIVSYQK